MAVRHAAKRQPTHRRAQRHDGITYADIERRWAELSDCAHDIVPTQLPIEPLPTDFDMLADDLRVLARRVDALVETYGDYLDANAPNIDRMLFKNVLSDALDGNALYEIERAAQQQREDESEIAYYTRHNRHAGAE
jgi:hypothetical protein